MTIKQTESVKKLKYNESINVGRVTIRKDRGYYVVVKDKFNKNFKDNEFTLMSETIDELNTQKDIVPNEPFEIEGTKLIGYKTIRGYEIYQNGNVIAHGLSESDFKTYVIHHKRELEKKKNEKVKKSIIKEHKVSNQKKVLYYFILTLSAILLVLVYVLGIKTDGVNFTRTNQHLYQTIDALAKEKYPEKKMDKFEAVYYTLNYYAHKDNYLMTEKELSDSSIVSIKSELLYKYERDGLNFDLSNDFSYSGHDFNSMFKDSDGRYVNLDLTYRFIGWIIGEPNITNLTDLASAYKRWDENDSKVNVAYEWEVISPDGSKPFDTRVNHYRTYLSRNMFFKLFLNDASKFIHEYNMFESVGWLSWTSVAVLLLYIILAICIWIFRKDSLKISKALVTMLIVFSAIIIIPLILQYFFEGLNKSATEFLDVVENTRFTTTTTVMNFIFNYLMKFGNIALTGLITIALPLKVIRYFVFDSINKLDKDKTVTKIISPDTAVSQRLSEADWRL